MVKKTKDNSKNLVSICSIKGDIDFAESLGIKPEVVDDIETIIKQCLQENSLEKACEAFDLLIKAKGYKNFKDRKTREQLIKRCLIKSLWSIKSGLAELSMFDEDYEEGVAFQTTDQNDKVNMYR